MKKSHVFLMVSLLGVSDLAWAEGGCPAGMIPYSGTDLSSCGPVPAGYYGDNSNQIAPQSSQAPVLWADTWGAIAVDKKMGRMGAASSKSSRREAEKEAKADCYARGGGDGCKTIALTYHNQCAAMAWGESASAEYHAETKELASNLAINACNKLTLDCQIYYSACSLPRRIQ